MNQVLEHRRIDNEEGWTWEGWLHPKSLWKNHIAATDQSLKWSYTKEQLSMLYGSSSTQGARSPLSAKR